MEAPAKGAVVVVRFPFSDLSRTKLRPAVVLADVGRGDYVLCQVTSKPYADPAAVMLDAASFATGSLPVASYARPGKLFTASTDLVEFDRPPEFFRLSNEIVGNLAGVHG